MLKNSVQSSPSRRSPQPEMRIRRIAPGVQAPGRGRRLDRGRQRTGKAMDLMMFNENNMEQPSIFLEIFLVYSWTMVKTDGLKNWTNE